MNKKLWIFIVLAVVLAAAMAYVYWPQNYEPSGVLSGAKNVPSAKQPLVGGDKDNYGCIGSAGYSWCAAKSKCLRTWEEYCGEARLDPVFVFLTSLRQQFPGIFDYIKEVSFEWFVPGERSVEDGLSLYAREVNLKQFEALKTYFTAQGFVLDKNNQADSPTDNLYGYLKNKMVCHLNRKFTDIKTNQSGDLVQINADKQQVDIYCGLRN